jgi:hypothetical protein
MIDRRMFLQDSALLAVSLAAWPVLGARAEDAVMPERFAGARMALVDRRIPGSADFAAEALRLRLPLFEFDADVATLWMSELLPRLRAGTLAAAGYSSAATLFCLDLLARDFGARTVRRAEAGAVVSFVISQNPGRRAALAPAAVRAHWSEPHA